jgi:sulfite exporter TauE/SafE/copper chaperone CopZ
MTCRACEVRISKAIKAIPGVQQVKVSAAKGRAEVTANRTIERAKLEAAVRKAGYTPIPPPKAGTKAGNSTGRRPLISRDRQVWQDLAVAVVLAALGVVAWQALGLSRVGDAASRAATGGSLAFVMLLGVAASLSTCMALVGGIVMGLSANHAARFPDATRAQRLRPQAMFNLGRIVGFAALGAVVGAIGSAFSLKGRLLGLAMLAAALVMAFLGVKLTGVFPKLAGASITLPAALTRGLHTDQGTYRDTTALVLGAASFFLPCGFTQAMQVYAFSTGNPAKAALIMGLFAVGTTPGLMGVGALASLAKGPTASRVFRFVGVAVLGFGLLTGISAFRLICPHSPGARPAATSTTAQATQAAGAGASTTPGTGTTQGPTTGSNSATTPGTTANYSALVTSNVTFDGATQQAKVTILGGYDPEETVIVAGLPTQLVFDLVGYGCAGVVDASVFGYQDWLYMEPGDNTFDLPALEPGTYDYSCAMGMYWGRVTVVEAS